jgi:hypothetical protein
VNELEIYEEALYDRMLPLLKEIQLNGHDISYDAYSGEPRDLYELKRLSAYDIKAIETIYPGDLGHTKLFAANLANNRRLLVTYGSTRNRITLVFNDDTHKIETQNNSHNNYSCLPMIEEEVYKKIEHMKTKRLNELKSASHILRKELVLRKLDILEDYGATVVI